MALLTVTLPKTPIVLPSEAKRFAPDGEPLTIILPNTKTLGVPMKGLMKNPFVEPPASVDTPSPKRSVCPMPMLAEIARLARKA